MSLEKENYRRCRTVLKRRNIIRNEHLSLHIHGQNSYLHEKTKFDLAYYLIKAGHHIETEVEFNGGGRADILDLDEAVVYEVLVSEDIIKFESKKSLYPKFLTIIPVFAKELQFDNIKNFLGLE